MTDRQTEGRPEERQLAALPRDLPPAAAGLVHEVKNPLAAIHLHMQLLESMIHQVKDSDLRDRMIGKAGLIKREILGLNQTLQDFLRMVRQERVERQIGDLNQVVREIVELLLPQAQTHGMELSFSAGDLEENLVFEPTFVKQVLINLILNSIQAFEGMPEDSEKKILVQTGMENGHPFMRVTDNGPGIAPEVQARIFDPFFSTREEGSGLGLALVQKMAGQMGGEVNVESIPGQGARFTVVLGKSHI